MDTLKDREVLEDLVEQGRMLWRMSNTLLTTRRASYREAGRDRLSVGLICKAHSGATVKDRCYAAICGFRLVERSTGCH